MDIRSLGVLSICLTSFGSGSDQAVDLAITHAAVLDVRTGRVLPNQTVIIAHGVIEAISSTRAAAPPAALQTIDANGRLLTPAFVDAHLHTALIFGDSAGTTHLVMEPDSIEAYRRNFAQAYMPYGVTAVRDVGSAQRDMAMLLAWMRQSADSPDFYPVGAQLVSSDSTRVPLPWQVEVSDSGAAASKVREYYGLGLRNIKLMWRLREPEFKSALDEAQALGMNVTAHIDQRVMTVGQALDLGLRNVEHIHTLALSILTDAELDSLYAHVPEHLGVTFATYKNVHGFYYLLTMEFWKSVGRDNPRVLALIDKFKADDASLTPTLHVFAQRLGLTYFASPPENSSEDTEGFTVQQRARAIEGYRIMSSYIKRFYDAGIRLNVGTDTRDPGKAVLSEMLLLHDAGIPMAAVFEIATLDSARDIGQEAQYGSVEVGKRADLILFDRNPIQNPTALLAGKTVIKDGVTWSLAAR